MCGIFGFLTAKEAFSIRESRGMADRLFCLSESRGKESAGLAVLWQDSILVCKQAVKASKMIHSQVYRSLFDQLGKNSSPDGQRKGKSKTPLVLMGHSRLVTNGSQTIYDNNQPVIRDGLIGIHNGIIVNDQKLWQNFPELERHYDVDTEVILALIRHFHNQTGSFVEATRRAFSHIEGTASLAIFCQDLNVMTLVTNNGSLYFSTDGKNRLHSFASGEYILPRALAELADHISRPDVSVSGPEMDGGLSRSNPKIAMETKPSPRGMTLRSTRCTRGADAAISMGTPNSVKR
jgi:glucosamine 6-phosphate synthetase-like amidotransferase/phosphosugar isomerase protein